MTESRDAGDWQKKRRTPLNFMTGQVSKIAQIIGADTEKAQSQETSLAETERKKYIFIYI